MKVFNFNYRCSGSRLLPVGVYFLAASLSACSNEVAPYHSYRMLALAHQAETQAAAARKSNEELMRLNQSLNQTLEQIRLAVNDTEHPTPAAEPIRSLTPKKKHAVIRAQH